MKNQILLIDTGWYTQYLSDRKANVSISAETLANMSPAASILDVGDNEATIVIEGPITQDGPDALDRYLGYGGVSYEDIQSALIEAHELLPSGSPIYIEINTPGGDMSGVESTYLLVKEIVEMRDVNTSVHGMCASAGIWVTAPSTTIKAIGSTCLIGSVGVATQVVDFKTAYEGMGIKIYDMTNEQSKDKRPDTSTEEGRGVVTARLNALYEVFITNEVDGRGGRTSREKIEKLKGAVVTSNDALAVGFIDSVELPTFGITGPGEGFQGEDDMKLSELLAANPDAKADLELLLADAKALGNTEGKAEEQSAMQARAKTVEGYLASDVYGSAVKGSCVKVITGERTLDAAKDMVSMADKAEELRIAAEADLEANGQKPTPPADPALVATEKTQREVDSRSESLLALL